MRFLITLALLALAGTAQAELNKAQIDPSSMPRHAVLYMLTEKANGTTQNYVVRYDDPKPLSGYGFQMDDGSTVQLQMQEGGKPVSIRWSKAGREYNGRLHTVLEMNGKKVSVVLLDDNDDNERAADIRKAESYIRRTFGK